MAGVSVTRPRRSISALASPMNCTNERSEMACIKILISSSFSGVMVFDWFLDLRHSTGELS